MVMVLGTTPFGDDATVNRRTEMALVESLLVTSWLCLWAMINVQTIVLSLYFYPGYLKEKIRLQSSDWG